MAIEVNVPDIGDFTDVPVLTVLVSVGDTVSEEDPLIELESDKATMEVPSPASGTVKEIKVSEGDKVSEGTVIMIFEEASGGDAPAKEEKKEEPKKEEASDQRRQDTASLLDATKPGSHRGPADRETAQGEQSHGQHTLGDLRDKIVGAMVRTLQERR